MTDLKAQVREFWESAPCGEVYARGDSLRERLEAQARARYELEPYIRTFARFETAAGKNVLEIGVGMGADHLEWARARPRRLAGIDLTPRAVEFTRERLRMYGLESALAVSDAENLPFPDRSFDLVYSWGVLHHTPNTTRAIQEVHRVARPEGTVRLMLYQRHSLVGYMLWTRYGLLAGRPGRSLTEIYARHLESPGTQAFTAQQVRHMLSGFSRVEIHHQLSSGDLLEGSAGQRHRGAFLSLARTLWPRWLVERALARRGLFLLIEAIK
jgi:ubiquinone/menaquinone biosynthesis C-methylase UbiE